MEYDPEEYMHPPNINLKHIKVRKIRNNFKFHQTNMREFEFDDQQNYIAQKKLGTESKPKVIRKYTIEHAGHIRELEKKPLVDSNLTAKQKEKIEPYKKSEIPKTRKMDEATLKKFKEYLLQDNIEIQNAIIDKTQPKNCGSARCKVTNVPMQQKISMEKILNLGGRVEIMKINQDNDRCVHQRNFQVKFSNDRPNIEMKKQQINDIKNSFQRQLSINKFEKRKTYTQQEYSQKTLQKKRYAAKEHFQKKAKSASGETNFLEYKGKKCVMVHDPQLKMDRLVVDYPNLQLMSNKNHKYPIVVGLGFKQKNSRTITITKSGPFLQRPKEEDSFTGGLDKSIQTMSDNQLTPVDYQPVTPFVVNISFKNQKESSASVPQEFSRKLTQKDIQSVHSQKRINNSDMNLQSPSRTHMQLTEFEKHLIAEITLSQRQYQQQIETPNNNLKFNVFKILPKVEENISISDNVVFNIQNSKIPELVPQVQEVHEERSVLKSVKNRPLTTQQRKRTRIRSLQNATDALKTKSDQYFYRNIDYKREPVSSRVMDKSSTQHSINFNAILKRNISTHRAIALNLNIKSKFLQKQENQIKPQVKISPKIKESKPLGLLQDIMKVIPLHKCKSQTMAPPAAQPVLVDIQGEPYGKKLQTRAKN